MPVKADASFSVSRALQLQLPKQLEILEEVSEYASREYSLERALDKMQVSACHKLEIGHVVHASCVHRHCQKLHTCTQSVTSNLCSVLLPWHA